jgi:hypothetical protein
MPQRAHTHYAAAIGRKKVTRVQGRIVAGRSKQGDIVAEREVDGRLHVAGTGSTPGKRHHDDVCDILSPPKTLYDAT